MEAGSDARALLAKILEEGTRQEQEIESETRLGGYDYGFTWFKAGGFRHARFCL